MRIQSVSIFALVAMYLFFLLVISAAIFTTQRGIEDSFVVAGEQAGVARAEEIATLIERELRNVESKLRIIAQLPEIREGDTQTCSKKAGELLIEMDGKVGSLNRFDTTGRFDCSTIPSVVGIRANATSAPYLFQLIEEPWRLSVLGTVTFSPFSNHSVIPLHVSVYNEEGIFTRSIGGAVYIDELQQRFLSGANFVEGGSLILIDADGTILYTPELTEIGNNVFSEIGTQKERIPPAARQAVTSDKSGFTTYETTKGKYLVAFSPVDAVAERRWSVLVTAPISSLVEAGSVERVFGLRPFVALYVFAAITSLSILVVYTTFIYRRAFKPLKEITAIVEKISLGETDVEISETLEERKDEIGSLARAFKRTLSSLKLAMRWTAPELKKESIELRKSLEAEKKAKEEAERISKILVGRELKLKALKKEVERLKQGKK